jgi:hypothetical protein
MTKKLIAEKKWSEVCAGELGLMAKGIEVEVDGDTKTVRIYKRDEHGDTKLD